ncbi:MAG: hypothetical protein CTY16_16555 [Methylobacter sp.]|nr:MAG: hypothetical protein CTY16_16555 [Methylobacter sp.]
MYQNLTKLLFLISLTPSLALGAQNTGIATEPQASKPHTQTTKALLPPASAPTPSKKPIVATTGIPEKPAAIAVKPIARTKSPAITSMPQKNTATAITLDPRKYYQVKSGDTLYSISVSSGHVFQDLAQWNHLPSPYQVRAGQILQLFNSPEEPATHPNQVKPSPAKENRPEPPKPKIPTTKKPSAPVIAPLTKQAKAPAAIKQPAVTEKKSAIPIDNKKVLKLNFKWPINGRVIKSFSQSNNQGIDIESTAGKQSVVAAEAGQIVYTGSGLSNLKNLVIIKHNQQYLTAYANNSRVIVHEEQQVKAGQLIAEMNASKKPGALHFQIRKNGAPVDPLNFLPK